MSIILNQKKEIVKQIRTKVKNSKAIIFYDFHFIADEQLFLLKKELKKIGADWKIYKNRLVQKAFDEEWKESKNLGLKQANALIFCQKDEYEPLKILNKFDQNNYEQNKINGGVYDNKLIPGDTLKEWAKLPSKQESLQMFCYFLTYNLHRLTSLLGQLEQQKKETN